MEPVTRRGFLAAAVAASLAGCQGSARGTATESTTREATDDPDTAGADTTAGAPPGTVALETLADGLGTPVDVAFAPDADRRYVVSQAGTVRVHESGGLREDPALDLRETVTVGYEKGLLGIALHPGFGDNRRVFLRYSAPRREGTPEGYSHTFVLAEFRATGDGRRFERDAARTLLEIPEPQANHNAGNLVFGPEGYLYVGVGDGGGADDRGPGHVGDWYDGAPGGNGQDVTENRLGSVLRIDVDRGDPYAVPEDNPLVGAEGIDEQYAWGLRNPWGMAFDRGELIVADVGQNDYEEVNVVEKGGNYGWNVREGAHCFRAADCPDRTPDDVRGGEPLRDPVIEYPHDGAAVSGTSVIGGEVYRGSALPGLDGRYVFGDLRADGELFVATPENGEWPVRPVEVAGGTPETLYAFGRDSGGEVYVLGDEGFYRIVPAG